MLAAVLLVALTAVVSAAPQQAAAPVPIIKQESDMKEDGSYSFS
jgi:hypothetical protein